MSIHAHPVARFIFVIAVLGGLMVPSRYAVCIQRSYHPAPPARALSMPLDRFIDYDAAQRGAANTMQANEAAQYYSTCLHHRLMSRVKRLVHRRRHFILQLDRAALAWLDTYFKCEQRIIGDGTFWTGEYYDSKVKLELQITNLETVHPDTRDSLRLASKVHPGGWRTAWCTELTSISAMKREILNTRDLSSRGVLTDNIAQCSSACHKLDALGSMMTREHRNEMARTVVSISSMVVARE